MMSTDFINSKVSEMPQVMKWVYIMLLKYNGYVTKYSEEAFPNDLCTGWRRLRHYTIIDAQGMTMEFTIDFDAGIIDGRFSRMEREHSPVYEIGSSKPPAYVPTSPQIHYRGVK